MALNVTALNLMADALKAAAPQLQLHSAAPDGTGSNMAASARQPAGWGASAAGAFSIGAPVPFTGGTPNGPVTHVSLRSAAGVYYGVYPVTGDASFNSAGEYTLNTLTITGS